MKRLFNRLLPYFITFVVIENLVRIKIGSIELGNLDNGLISLAKSMLIGLIPDTAAFLYILPLLLLIQFSIPYKKISIKSEKILQGVFYGIFLFIMLFTAVSEWLFWEELTSRFNFIAVDYLVYMDEVTGNINESYPVALIILSILIISILGAYIYTRKLKLKQEINFSQCNKITVIFSVLVIILCSFFTISESTSEFSDNRYENELAKNGIFSLFSAFRNNELSYADFYITDEPAAALAKLRESLNKDGYKFIDDGITRKISAKGKEIHPNVVLITVESLSAEYLKAFGNKDNLTPYLDKLSEESLFFTNMYATGTRTVYGLTSITLSIPPIPGNAIARRPDNDHLFSLGSVLNRKGYDSSFIYGGYGYFDNMNNFFSNNGYRIIDRSVLKNNEITFANIWGVCDGDIYERTLKENDASHNKGQPFFNMIMTTSNHQPFTYPEGKIDMQSGKGRLGGVKYSDYAIGDFIEKAKKHSWFDNTIFVIIADHTAGSSGKLALTPDRHHIPMMIYAPKLIKPGKVDVMASQIDLAPTLLALMNMNYSSRFYGHDLLNNPRPRAFIANYQHVGFLVPDVLTVLQPVKQSIVYTKENGEFKRSKNINNIFLDESVSYFQNASNWKVLSKDISN